MGIGNKKQFFSSATFYLLVLDLQHNRERGEHFLLQSFYHNCASKKSIRTKAQRFSFPFFSEIAAVHFDLFFHVKSTNWTKNVATNKMCNMIYVKGCCCLSWELYNYGQKKKKMYFPIYQKCFPTSASQKVAPLKRPEIIGHCRAEGKKTQAFEKARMRQPSCFLIGLPRHLGR